MSKDSIILTPAQAAERAGCGRTKIMKALKNKELYAVRNNKNRWQIDSADLDEWSQRNIEETVRVTDSATIEDSEKTAKISALSAEVSVLRERIDDLKEDRDSWRELALRPAPSLLERISGIFRNSSSGV